MKKHIQIYITIVLMLLFVGGCGMSINNNSKSDGELTELTEQQKQILQEEGIPPVLDKLSDKEKNYLITCDKMMTYINEKYAPYGVHFTYIGYHAPELLDETSKIVVVPDGYDPSIDTVTVKINANTEEGYEDDYLDFQTRIIYEKVLNDHLSEYVPKDKYKLYLSSATIREEIMPDISELNEEYILRNANSSNFYLFLSDDICRTNEELAEFAEDLFTWMRENKFYGTPQIELCKDEGLEYYDYKDISKTRIEYGIAYANANVKEDGIFELEIQSR